MSNKKILDELDHLETQVQKFTAEINYKAARLRNLLGATDNVPSKEKIKGLVKEAGARRRARIINS